MAKALDVVGDRWTLLIVRELLVRGAARYTDLQYGLPGIATNLLADRLRDMEEAGILRREAAPPPIATDLFRLTSRGEALAPVVHELGRWGGPLLREAGQDDVFRSHWLALPVGVHLRDRIPGAPPIAIEVRTGDQPITLEAIDGVVRTRLGTAERPDAILSGRPQLVVALLTGKLDLASAQAAGLEYRGDPAILDRVRPQAHAEVAGAEGR
jgi:DNA-binding HxlR family transcriptional regulator